MKCNELSDQLIILNASHAWGSNKSIISPPISLSVSLSVSLSIRLSLCFLFLFCQQKSS